MHALIRRSTAPARTVLLLLAAAGLGMPLAGQSLIAEVDTGGQSGSVGVNPVTGKVYATRYNFTVGDSVTVMDGASHATTSIFLGGVAQGLAVNPASNRVYVNSVTSLVNHLYVIDGATDTLVTSIVIPGTRSSIAVDPVLNRIFVTDYDGNTASVIDGVGNTLVATIPGVGFSPRGIAVNPVTHYVYIAGNDPTASVVVINGQTASLVRTLATGQYTQSVAVDPVTNKIYTTAMNFSANQTWIYVVNGETSGTAATVSPTNITFSGPIYSNSNSFSMAVNPATNKIYVPNPAGHSLVVINGASGATPVSAGPSVVLSAAASPLNVVVDPATNRIFTDDPANGKMYQLDGGSNTFTWSMPLLRIPGALAVNPVTGRVYAALPSDSLLAVFDERNNAASYGNSTGTGAGATAVNPVTGKAYVANTTGTSITVVPPAGPNKDVPVGGTPVKIVANPVSGKIYVLVDGGAGSGMVKVIDGATDAVTATVTVGHGPLLLGLNPVSNRIYEVSGANYNYAVIDGVSDTASFVGSPNGTGTPVALAVNQATNRIYVLYGSYTFEWHGEDNSLVNLNVAGGGTHAAMALNTLTNQFYIAYSDRSYITQVDGASINGSNIPTANPGDRIAVNEGSGKIYVGNSTGAAGHLEIVDGATATQLAALTLTNPVAAIVVNPDSNNIYVSETSGNLSIVDGISDAVKTAISTGIAAPALAVNPAAGRLFGAGGSGAGNILSLTERPASAVPLATVIGALAGNATTQHTPYFTFGATSSYSPIAPPPQQVRYQVDGWQGEWLPTNYLFGSWSATLPYLDFGVHTLYAFAMDGQEATSVNPASSPVPGQLAAYTFVVAPDAPVITAQPAAQSVCNQGRAVFSVTATAGGALSYQWRLNGVNLVNSGHVSGVTGGTLTVDPAGAGDVGSYDVVVSGSIGNYITPTTSTAAALTVDGAHSPPSDALNLKLVKGSPLQLAWTASASGGGFAVTYDVLRSTVPGDFTNTLSTACVASGIAGLAANDSPAGAAYYKVRAKNSCGYTSGVSGRSCP